MSIAGKRDAFARQELIEVGESISLKQPARVLDEVMTAVGEWPTFANQANVSPSVTQDIARHHRLSL